MEHNSIVKNMSHKTFNKFKNYIESNIGITIPDTKKIMVESRLLKRLRALNYDNYEDYSKYFFSVEGELNEVPRFVECITTNKTDFFREVDHFNFLTNHVYPELVGRGDVKELKLWSAASSIGEEAYTMAMVTDNYLNTFPGVNYKILATDISERVLEVGRKAIYPIGDIDPVPLDMRKKYCLKSRDRENQTFRIDKELRKCVSFKKFNLKEKSYNVRKLYHVIFLRNVMIYFNKEMQRHILMNLYRHLHPDGYLFLGHSENLPDNTLPFRRIGASIYVKEEY